MRRLLTVLAGAAGLVGLGALWRARRRGDDLFESNEAGVVRVGPPADAPPDVPPT